MSVRVGHVHIETPGELWRAWKRLRRDGRPRFAAFWCLTDDYLFDHKSWWMESDPDYRPWKGKVFNSTKTIDWVLERWPWCPHLVENDQCGMPEHRYCLWCRRPFPHYPLGSQKDHG